MDYINILKEFFVDESIFVSRKKRLIVFLGSFADFDSFEYCQQLADQSKLLYKYSIDLIIIGIGSQSSKEKFCDFNKMDIKNVFSVNNSDLHNQLNFNKGLVSPLPAIINLLIMCTGIKSKGTIKEVLRGYFGDRNANKLFSEDEIIKIGSISLFKGEMFDVFSKNDVLRPFELATRRLVNMIEILSNWNIYVTDQSYLTQRSATILLDENNQLLYEFISESLLGYSSNMSKPISFLEDFLN
ncbi:AhpC/TSA family protein [Prochlorococcus marinus]|uniref:Uncharacterized protein n=1 Tax=Prochlorococcus marinus XMU1408 TaxID=2213228 RepID=A0A318RGM7_PROMR|nr:AhpC/TSA family protein [Prochlorococcus marinus]MBW3041813.1 hypothetical protein [Prochlorococcus marinus str. XMU1408]PYE02953.1 hypothetical protein DNJ73_04185 [Prochlorococcus marinus XMU1408]